MMVSKTALVTLALLQVGASLKAVNTDTKPGDVLTYWEGWPKDVYPTHAPKREPHWENKYAMKENLDIPLTGCQICTMTYEHMSAQDKAPCAVNFYHPENLDGTPIEGGKFPLIAFVHGNQHGGPLTHDAYAESIFRPLVGDGYAIVAFQTVGNWMCHDMMPAELERSLTWLNTSSFSSMVNWNRVALTGYSLGGHVVLDVAEKQDFVDKWNVRFAFPLLPWCSDEFPCGRPVTATLYAEPFHDKYAPWCFAFPSYDQAPSLAKWWLRIQDTNHTEVGAFGDNRHMPCVRKGLKCFLSDSMIDCHTMNTCQSRLTDAERVCGKQAKEDWY